MSACLHAVRAGTQVQADATRVAEEVRVKLHVPWARQRLLEVVERLGLPYLPLLAPHRQLLLEVLREAHGPQAHAMPRLLRPLMCKDPMQTSTPEHCPPKQQPSCPPSCELRVTTCPA